MIAPQNLATPPSFLDLFKDVRIKKTWVIPEGCSMYSEQHSLVIDAPNILRVWPGLMGEPWDETQCYSDARAIWQRLSTVVDKYNTCFDTCHNIVRERKLECFALNGEKSLQLNCVALLFFIRALPGPMAQYIHIQDAFFSFFPEIRSRNARKLLTVCFGTTESSALLGANKNLDLLLAEEKLKNERIRNLLDIAEAEEKLKNEIAEAEEKLKNERIRIAEAEEKLQNERIRNLRRRIAFIDDPLLYGDLTA